MWKLTKKVIKSVFGSWAKVRNGSKRPMDRSVYFCAVYAPQNNCNRREHASCPGLQSTHTYHKYMNHPAIYRTQPSSSGHEA
eukprot:1159036-Pelagomonas_calceolata.AAC.10